MVQTIRYDGLGQRVMRDETGGGGEKRWFFYNEKWQVIEERVSSQNYWNAPADAQYVYHPQYVDAVALRYWDSDATGGADKEHYYLQDSNFNVTAIVENDGTVAERYAYSPYGEVTVLDADFSVDPNGSDIDNEYLFTGRRLDPVTGLQLNRHRFYTSHLGRWVNRDPIGYWGGTNLYGYVGGMPTRYLDPTGLNHKPSSCFGSFTPGCGPDVEDPVEQLTTMGQCSITCQCNNGKTVNVTIDYVYFPGEAPRDISTCDQDAQEMQNEEICPDDDDGGGGGGNPIPPIPVWPSDNNENEKPEMNELPDRLPITDKYPDEQPAIAPFDRLPQDEPQPTPIPPIIVPGVPGPASPATPSVPWWKRIPLRIPALPIFIMPIIDDGSGLA